GLDYDSHIGPVQQANGNILKESRGSLYVGAGAFAVAAGTVTIPGVYYNLNLSNACFTALAARQRVAAQRFASLAVRNEQLRRVAAAYAHLLRAEALRGAACQTRLEADKVKFVTTAQFQTGLGRKGDADRAANEVELRTIDL